MIDVFPSFLLNLLFSLVVKSFYRVALAICDHHVNDID